jgi:hypothetical protein
MALMRITDSGIAAQLRPVPSGMNGLGSRGSAAGKRTASCGFQADRTVSASKLYFRLVFVRAHVFIRYNEGIAAVGAFAGA